MRFVTDLRPADAVNKGRTENVVRGGPRLRGGERIWRKIAFFGSILKEIPRGRGATDRPPLCTLMRSMQKDECMTRGRGLT